MGQINPSSPTSVQLWMIKKIVSEGLIYFLQLIDYFTPKLLVEGFCELHIIIVYVYIKYTQS